MKTIQPTSLEAYKNMRSKIPTDQELILAVLSDEKEMTYNEIAKAVRIKLYNDKNTFTVQSWVNPNKVSRRMLELINADENSPHFDKVIYGKVRKCTIAKSNCKTYLLNK